ncbi:MAG: ketopantoate reductase family protein [Endozoicomonas sp.]
MSQITWYILGAGSMGCLWAAYLRKKGLPVTLILREHHLESHQDILALRLTRSDEKLSFHVHTATSATINSPVSRLIVCTKAQDSLTALESIRRHLAHQCSILLIQNGMGNQHTIAEAFSEQNIWAASSTDGAYLKQPFSVVHAGKGHTWIGPMNQSATTVFTELLDSFSLSVGVCDDIEHKLWQKLAINCCINGLTALFNCHNGELLDNGAHQEFLERLIAETTLVLQKSGYENSLLREQVFEVSKATARNTSSTCQDARQGRKTELAFINGFLIRQAASFNISLPTHKKLMNLLKMKSIE